ncbi:hypothetical protein [Salinivibrio costicola]|uniref:hypothetical protein n=1 Tax=Salinivibrio costicola TaxID=51367 RepID=UPI000470AD1B|nr:hypothetical protein [Salinivibrio costicola]
MRKTLLALFIPLALPAYAANIVDATSIDLSEALAPEQSRSAMVNGSPLSYQEQSRLNIGGQSLVRKQQLHYGIPVYGYSVVENTSARNFAPDVKGEVVTGIESDIGSTLPMLNQQQAIAIAQGESTKCAAIKQP